MILQQDQLVTELISAVRGAAGRLKLSDQVGLVAVSGGIDSTALLIALRLLNLRLDVVTFDHGLREEAAGEVAWVCALADRLNVRIHVSQLKVRSGPGLEERGRQARYLKLHALRRQHGFGWIATGHTASDQAETVLMRLARGCVLKGARGILEAREDGVVRPLLDVTRRHTQALVAAHDLRACEDPMNSDRTFTRIRLRRDVIPVLIEAVNPDAERAIARFAKAASSDEAWLEAKAKQAFRRLAGPFGLRRSRFLALPDPLRRRVLTHFLADAQLEASSEAIEQGIEAILEGRSLALPRDRLLRPRGIYVEVVKSPPRTRRQTCIDATGANDAL